MTPSFVQADKPVSSGAFEQTDKGSLWVANSQSGKHAHRCVEGQLCSIIPLLSCHQSIAYGEDQRYIAVLVHTQCVVGGGRGML